MQGLKIRLLWGLELLYSGLNLCQRKILLTKGPNRLIICSSLRVTQDRNKRHAPLQSCAVTLHAFASCPGAIRTIHLLLDAMQFCARMTNGSSSQITLATKEEFWSLRMTECLVLLEPWETGRQRSGPMLLFVKQLCSWSRKGLNDGKRETCQQFQLNQMGFKLPGCAAHGWTESEEEPDLYRCRFLSWWKRFKTGQLFWTKVRHSGEKSTVWTSSPLKISL